MPKFRVYGIVTGSKYIGEYEAETEGEACNLAEKDAYVSFCHKCARECDSAEIGELQAEPAD